MLVNLLQNKNLVTSTYFQVFLSYFTKRFAMLRFDPIHKFYNMFVPKSIGISNLQ